MPRAQDIGNRHFDAVTQIMQVIGRGNSLTSRESLTKLVKDLQRRGLLGEEEANALIGVINRLFKGGDEVRKLLAAIEALVGALYQLGNELLSAIASIIVESVRFIYKNAPTTQNVMVAVAIIAADVGGALTGALTLSAGGVQLAAIGAVAGAVSASAMAFAEAVTKGIIKP